MRIRSLRPERWADRRLAKNTSLADRLLLLGLENVADEHARFMCDPEYLKGQLFPYDADMTPGVIAESLGRLAGPEVGRVVIYDVGGDVFGYLPMLGEENKLEPFKARSRVPAPPEHVCLPCLCLMCRPDLYPPDPKDRKGCDLTGRSFDRANLKPLLQGVVEPALGLAAPPPRPAISPSRSDKSESGADLSEPRADKSPLSYVVGLSGVGMSGVPDPGGAQTAARPAPADAVESEFQNFWGLWPKDEDRPGALEAFRGARSRGISARVLAEGARRYADQVRRDDTQYRFVLRARTWLEREGYAESGVLRGATPQADAAIEAEIERRLLDPDLLAGIPDGDPAAERAVRDQVRRDVEMRFAAGRTVAG